jgi:RimJ/RimL family protein N-acetyltransferase
MVPLITERLLLRALRESDLECVFAILNDETTTAGVSWRQHTREDAGAWLARRIESQGSLGVSMWGVEDRSSAEIVGLCGFFPHESQLELGYVIHARFWGRGFATESARACVEHALRAGHRICATIRPGNRSSLRVAEKAGLHFNSNIRDERGELLVYVTPHPAKSPSAIPDRH